MNATTTKTEFDYGYEYADFCDATETVDIDEMCNRSCDIPDGDYTEMKRAGIENPDPREYWRGYNSFVEVTA